MGCRCSYLCDVRKGIKNRKIFFFFHFSLSGLSPFGGQDDDETMENIRKCNVRFPDEAFGVISDDGKDFIQKLLLKNRK